MAGYFPEIKDRIVGHEMHGNICHRYELKDVYLSEILDHNVRRNLKSGYLDEGIPTGLVRILDRELTRSRNDLEETLSHIEQQKQEEDWVSNHLRKKRLHLELREQRYRNALSTIQSHRPESSRTLHQRSP